ncbi:hypothetical protein ACJIZ3_004493 [Penstemon smallii]|uniref:30S ribosomal protein S21, chloroplastic n=1 Tax=Penstemon smallii TaxID=265156 RepID=A0ABD3S269_9LAMI
MALSKLNPLFFFFFSPKTPIPTQKPPPPQLFILPAKNPFPLQLKTQFSTPSILLTRKLVEEEEEEEKRHFDYMNPDSLSVAFPSLAFSNTLFFNSAYNVQVIVGENEPEEKLIGRFRRDVLRAGVLQECKRRRFFETTQEKRKRKKREAARKNRKRRPGPKVFGQVKEEVPKKKDDSDDDNWEFLAVDVPYT